MPTDDDADDGLVKEFNATAHKLVRLTIAMMEGPDGVPTNSVIAWLASSFAALLASVNGFTGNMIVPSTPSH
jgi:hypothetical protein